MRREGALWLAAASAGSLAVGASTGSHLLLSLNDLPPLALSALERSADPPPGPGAKGPGRAVVVLLDGVGEGFLRPSIEAGELGPALAVVPVEAGLPSLSRPGYHSLLTGVPQQVSGIRANFVTRGRADAITDRVREAGGKVAFLQETVPWFAELFAREGDLVVGSASPEAFERAWASGASLAIVHLTATDGAGHAEGAASEAYRRAVSSQLATVKRMREIEASLGGTAYWFVGADHGHLARGGHGGPEPEVTRVAWAVLSPRAAPAPAPAERLDAGRYFPMTSVVPLIAGALGVAAPRQALSEPPPLTIAPSPSPSLAARQAAVSEALAEGDRASRQRAAVAAAPLGLAAAALGRRRPSAWAGALLPALGALAGFVLFGPGLTLSAIRTELSFLITGGLSMTVGALAMMPLSLRLGASPWQAVAASVAAPLASLCLTAGSLGRSQPGPLASLLLPSLGLVPAGVMAAAWAAWLFALVRRR